MNNAIGIITFCRTVENFKSALINDGSGIVGAATSYRRPVLIRNGLRRDAI